MSNSKVAILFMVACTIVTICVGLLINKLIRNEIRRRLNLNNEGMPVVRAIQIQGELPVNTVIYFVNDENV